MQPQHHGAVLFPLSGWLAALTGYLTSGGVPENEAISVLLQSIPLNFYCILAVFGTLAVSLFGINIGEMRKAEERTKKTVRWIILAVVAQSAKQRKPLIIQSLVF